MTRYYCGAAILAALMVLLVANWGLCSVPQENQEVLSKSKIKKNEFSRIFRNIRKTLPDQSKKCPIIVSGINFLQAGNDNAEDWTVNVCEETKSFFVYAYLLKGAYLCIVKPKGEQFEKEKKIWDAAKKSGDEATWRKALFYIDEIERLK